jgi:hypothetical protein
MQEAALKLLFGMLWFSSFYAEIGFIKEIKGQTKTYV